jgi:hypothetical protein
MTPSYNIEATEMEDWGTGGDDGDGAPAAASASKREWVGIQGRGPSLPPINAT